MDVCNIDHIRALLARHGFHFSKSMGQNFLIESWVPEDIAAASKATSQHCVLEIGPGIGPLTRQLSDRAGKVVAVELDRSLLPILSETLQGRNNVEIIPGDIMKLNIPDLVREHFSGLIPAVCANLPYNITSPVITALIEANCFESITVMIQREVALRICAAPGTSDYGAFSVFCQFYTKPELLFDVPNTCFIPAPKVTSSVLRLIPAARPDGVKDESFFFRVVRASFAQRRKTLHNSLSSSLGQPFTREMIAQAIAACGLSSDIRGERLGIAEFTALSNQLLALV